MNLEYGHLDQLVEIKRQADVEFRNYDKKNYEGKNPAEVQRIINVKYKNKLIKEFKKLLKKYDPNKELVTQIVKNAHEDDRNY